MARIEEYTSTKELKPSDIGFSAAETAARRVGPLAQQSAADIEKQGKMAAEFAANSTKFAYEFTSPFADLLEKNRGGGGLKQGKSGVERTLIGTGSGGSRDDNRDANEAGQAVKYNGPDVATGAAKLSARLKNVIAPGGAAVDPISGEPVAAQPGQQQQYWKDPETGKVSPIPQDPAQQALNPGVTILNGGPSPSGVTVIRGGPGARLTSVGDWNGGGPQPLGFIGPDGQRYMPVSGHEPGGGGNYAGPIKPEHAGELIPNPIQRQATDVPFVTAGQTIQSPLRDAAGNRIAGPQDNTPGGYKDRTIYEQPIAAPVIPATGALWWRQPAIDQSQPNVPFQYNGETYGPTQGPDRSYGAPTQDIPTPTPLGPPPAPATSNTVEGQGDDIQNNQQAVGDAF